MKLRNLLIGMGSVFDLFPGPRKPLHFPRPVSDEEAIRSDWQAVGDDLRAAMKKVDLEQERTNDAE